MITHGRECYPRIIRDTLGNQNLSDMEIAVKIKEAWEPHTVAIIHVKTPQGICPVARFVHDTVFYFRGELIQMDHPDYETY